MSRIIIFHIAILLAFSSNIWGRTGQVQVDFYSESLSLPRVEALAGDFIPAELNENQLERFYQLLPHEELKSLSTTFAKLGQEWHLNDFLLFKLVDQYSQSLVSGSKSSERMLSNWVLLRTLGFRPLLVADQKRGLHLFVQSQDSLAEGYQVFFEGEPYIQLLAARHNSPTVKVVSPRIQEGKPFALSIREVPQLPHARYRKLKVSFTFQGQKQRLTYAANHTWAEIMQDYPAVLNFQYVDVSLDRRSQASLVAQLQKACRDLAQQDQVRYLLALVRQGFTYKSDQALWEVAERPLTAEEMLFFRMGDCEDKTALFYQLQKEWLGLPMIVMDLPQHLTVATAIPGNLSSGYTFDGRQYFLTEPSNSANSLDLGQLPSNSHKEFAEARVIGSWYGR